MTRRPKLMVEDQGEQNLLFVDMVCPKKVNKMENKLKKYKSNNSCLTNELLERRPGFMVKVVPIVTGCLGDGIKQFEKDIRDLFITKKRLKIVSEVQKTLS